jgi:RHH-type rel operon transcriptional repressor/antitoxin RelB
MYCIIYALYYIVIHDINFNYITMSTLCVRIPDKLDHMLESFAAQEERSKTFIVRKALESYLEDLQDYNSAEAGYKRYVESGKKGHDLKTVAKRLNIDLKDL